MLTTNGVSSISRPQMKQRKQLKQRGREDVTVHIPETAAILVSIGGRLQDAHGTWWERK